MEETDLDKALAVKLKGNEKFKNNEFEEAKKLYTEAISICPPHRKTDLSIIFQNRAAANEKIELLEEAVKDCSQSISLNNKYGKSYDRRSKILKKMALEVEKDDLDQRIAHLRQALEDVSVLAHLDGYRPDHLMFVDQLLKELGSGLAVRAGKKREALLPSGHSISQYFTSFVEDPLFEDLSGEGHYCRAQESFKRKEFDKIVPLCDQEISANGPYNLKAKLLKATILILTKQLKEAFELLNTVIEESPGTEKKIKVNALVKRGSLYIQRCQDPVNDSVLSLADFAAALELEPLSADAFMNRGQINLLLDNFQAAVDDLTKASELRPDFALANVQKLYTDFLGAQVRNDVTAVNGIMEKFQSAVKKYSDCVEAYALYAKILQETGKIDEADEMYRKGMELNPDNSNLIVHRALLHLQRTGDVVKTLADIDRAVKVDPKCEFAYETLGQLEIQRENLEAAVSAFDKAIPLVNTELEMAHLFGLRESAYAKNVAKKKLQDLPSGMQDLGLD